jgi:hypothetical protein
VSKTKFFLDFGTELMAGIRLETTVRGSPVTTMAVLRIDLRLWQAPAGTVFLLQLGEELTGPTTVMEPMRTGNDFHWTWSDISDRYD